MKTYVLDASALYRFLTGGPGADVVSGLFRNGRDAEQPLWMSIVNWGEVYYTVARAQGFTEAGKVMERAKMLPLAILDADESVTTQAARLKAGHGLPFSDCFAAATAANGHVLVTSDVKDFKKIPGLQILALPEHRRKAI